MVGSKCLNLHRSTAAGVLESGKLAKSAQPEPQAAAGLSGVPTAAVSAKHRRSLKNFVIKIMDGVLMVNTLMAEVLLFLCQVLTLFIPAGYSVL